jgi:hypothetical protein
MTPCWGKEGNDLRGDTVIFKNDDAEMLFKFSATRLEKY